MFTYKYLPPDRIGFLDDRLLRFTPPGALNDPFECLPVVPTIEANRVLREFLAEREEEARNATSSSDAFLRLVQEARTTMLAKIENDPEHFKKLFFEIGDRKINSRVGILSLSKRWDSGLMWAHYAASHTGFCVGFDRTHRFFQSNDDGNGTKLTDVLYSENRIEVPVVKGEIIDFRLMFTKSLDWMYEQEERKLARLSRATKIREGEPYKVCLFEIPEDTISEMVVGARATDEVRSAVLSYCSRKNVPVFVAAPSSASFDVLRSEADQHTI
ncbi:MAG: DUF2971 domain-containing protein [Candidatus Eremiobacteraeota bacterium]|nr:DUF2971 domain-containing protein [Candidatus Eremiobacteraeota bacterium]